MSNTVESFDKSAAHRFCPVQVSSQRKNCKSIEIEILALHSFLRTYELIIFADARKSY